MSDKKKGIALVAAAGAIYLVIKSYKGEAKEPKPLPKPEPIVMGEIHVEWI